MPEYRIREAAELLGVSDDTLRRWAECGRIATTTDAVGRQVVDGAALARLAEELAAAAEHPTAGSVVGALGAQPVHRPGHPGRPRHRDGPGGDPGRARTGSCRC